MSDPPSQNRRDEVRLSPPAELSSPIETDPDPTADRPRWFGTLVAAGCLPAFCIGGILFSLLMPAIQGIREQARRAACGDNLRRIGLALQDYHDTHGTLPPAVITAADGTPLHSWRTAILPHLGRSDLFTSIDLSLPWDHPSNAAAAATVVDAYACPSMPGDPSLTTYLAVIDPRGMFRRAGSVAFGDVPDGLSETILVVEASAASAVPWMSPRDVDLTALISDATPGRHVHPGGGHVLTGDGAVTFMTETVDAELLRQRVTVDDGVNEGDNDKD